jgi:hypothetical protein
VLSYLLLYLRLEQPVREREQPLRPALFLVHLLWLQELVLFLVGR